AQRPRSREVRGRDVEVDGPLPAADREAAASPRLLAGLVAAELHDGAVEAARGADALHPVVQARAPVPRRPDRALVLALPDDLFGPRARARAADRPALLRALSLGRPEARRSAARHRDDAPGDHRGRRGGGVASRRRTVAA